MDEVERLIERLKDPDRYGRIVVCNRLGRIKDPSAVPALIDALDDENYQVGYMAALALGNIGDARAVEPLIEKLKDEDSEMRWMSARALAEIGLNEVQASLSKIVGSEKDPKQLEKSRRWAVKKYIMIAKAVSERKRKDMGGVSSEGKIKPPPKKPKMYRQMRRSFA